MSVQFFHGCAHRLETAGELGSMTTIPVRTLVFMVLLKWFLECRTLLFSNIYTQLESSRAVNAVYKEACFLCVRDFTFKSALQEMTPSSFASHPEDMVDRNTSQQCHHKAFYPLSSFLKGIKQLLRNSPWRLSFGKVNWDAWEASGPHVHAHMQHCWGGGFFPAPYSFHLPDWELKVILAGIPCIIYRQSLRAKGLDAWWWWYRIVLEILGCQILERGDTKLSLGGKHPAEFGRSPTGNNRATCPNSLSCTAQELH